MKAKKEYWTHTQKNIDNWVEPPISGLPRKFQILYQLRKKALTRYYKGEGTVKEIERAFGISKSEIYRLSSKALSKNRYGEITGWLACVPYYRPIPQYTRTTSKTSGTAGHFTKLLKDHDLEQDFKKIALGKKAINGSAVRGKELEGIYHAFKTMCEEAGIDVHDHYPFNNIRGAQETVRNYVNKVRKENFIDSVRVEHGSQVASMAMAEGKGYNNTPSPLRPYDRVQLDEHKIDSIPVLLTYDSYGELVVETNARVWVVVMMDERSRAALGYSISLTQQYTEEDLVECFANVLQPSEKIVHPNPKPPYIPNAGFPSGIFKQCAWRIFNRIQVDNAYAHLSHWLWDRLTHIGVGEICLLRPGAPRQNKEIERLFGTFTRNSFQKLPNTTGSNPKDPRRKKYPDKKAAQLGITIEHITQIVDFTLANYNATPHSSLDGRTPLEVVENYINKADHPIRIHDQKSTDSLEVFDEDIKCFVRASKKHGHAPYVQYLNGRYSSQTMKMRGELVNKQVILRINRKDIRKGVLYQTNGEIIGEVSVSKRWSWVKHTASIRRAINREIVRGNIMRFSHNPIGEYYEYLRKASKNSKHELNKFISFEKKTGLDKKNNSNSSDKSESSKSDISPHSSQKNQKNDFNGDSDIWDLPCD